MKRYFWNASEQRLRALWRVVLHLVLLLLTVSLLSAVMAAVLPGWPALTVATLVGTLAVTFIAVRLFDKRSFRDLGLRHSPAWWLDLAFGTALGLLLMTAIFLVQYELGWATVVDTMITRSEDTNFMLSLVIGLAMMAAVGVYEELILRGYQLTNLAEGFETDHRSSQGAVVQALLVTSVFFGLAHVFNPNATILSTVNIMLAGVMLGLGYVLTGRLGLPIGLHFSWNASQGLVFGFPVSGFTGMFDVQLLAVRIDGTEAWTGGGFGPEGGFISTLAMVAGILIIFAWARVHEGRSAPDPSIAVPPSLSRE
jgi:uncharacterized protein